LIFLKKVQHTNPILNGRQILLCHWTREVQINDSLFHMTSLMNLRHYWY
jgi:hypothetical protein